MNNKTKFFITSLIVFSLGSIQAQQIIGKKILSGSGLVDFEADSQKVIILPLVDTLPTSPSFGTLLAFKRDSSVYMRNDSAWVKFGNRGKIPTTFLLNSGIERNLGVLMGAKTTSASGVLVLESTNRALILPKNNNPHSNIVQPRIGSICYDKVRKALAIYNGDRWVYWR